MSRRRRKKDGLETKVQKVRTRSDEQGLFIPYCNFHFHRGVCLNDDVCEQRACKHYTKLYIQPKYEKMMNLTY